jgi:hypothetical protein
VDSRCLLEDESGSADVCVASIRPVLEASRQPWRGKQCIECAHAASLAVVYQKFTLLDILARMGALPRKYSERPDSKAVSAG